MQLHPKNTRVARASFPWAWPTLKESVVKAPLPKGVGSSPRTNASRWPTSLAPGPNPQDRRSSCASARHREQPVDGDSCLTLPMQVGRSASDLCSKRHSARARVRTQPQSQMFSPSTAFRTAGQDFARRCHDRVAEWSTGAVPSEGPEGAGPNPAIVTNCPPVCYHV